ncbi:ABC transporter ATP-binding protein [Shewanella sp. OPT22]|nr:ABC transporter ATP-binding protein [Shewanella sp. OPT22]
MKNAALTVSNLNWSIDGNQILSEIDLELAKNQMLGLIGPNGSGKSSLLRCLYGFIKADSGAIQLFGRSIKDYSANELAKCLAVVQQDTPSNLDITTEQLVMLGLTPHKSLLSMTSKKDHENVSSALAKVELSHKAKQNFKFLSGGERQRALIARAIVQQPKLLILDEPTNHLDIRYQIQILELVKSLDITVIASIHDLNLASSLCDNLLMLEEGQVSASGRPKQVLTEKRIADVFGVCSAVTEHPQNGRPLIQYFYGYTPKESVQIYAEGVK